MNIILNDFEIQNLLKNGRGQIRRVCKVQPPNGNYKLGRETSGKYEGKLFWYDDGFCLSEHFICPFGAVGEELAVKETWRERWGMSYANYGCGSAYPVDDVHEIGYKDDISIYFAGLTLLCPDECTIKSDSNWSNWKSSVTMPREASRLTIVPERIWVERVRKITEDSIKAEGIDPKIYPHHNFDYFEPFKILWDSHAKPGYKWANNPMVWCAEVRAK